MLAVDPGLSLEVVERVSFVTLLHAREVKKPVSDLDLFLEKFFPIP